MKDRAAAMRYAKALFELASSKELELKIEEDLLAFQSNVQSDRSLANFFLNPILKLDEKKELLLKFSGKNPETLTIRFLLLLIKQGRFTLLDSAIESFHQILNESRHFEEVIITTAKPLNPKLKSAVEKMLEQKIGEKIISEARVDPKLLGGITIQIRNRLLDGSVRTKLDDLEKQMIGK